MEAAVEAVETVDKCVGRVVEAIRSRGGKDHHCRSRQCRTDAGL